MEIEDIKSPLPPRKTNLIESEVMPEEKPVFTEPEPVLSQPVKKGFSLKNLDKNQLIIFGIIGAVIVLILVLIFAIIVPNLRKGKNQQTVLTYWGLWEDSSVVEGIIADFESQNPNIKINYIKNQKDDYRTRLEGRLARTDQEDVPDVFRIHNTWIPMFRENLAPVPAATVTNLQLSTDFFNVYQQDLKEGNSYLAIPLMYDGLALFYNKDLINGAQIDLPKSWWNLEDAANKLTVKDGLGKIITSGVAMGLTDNIDHWSDILGLMMKQNGVDFLIDTPENDQKIRDVLTFYTLFANRDKVWDTTLPQSTELFANGKLGFYFAPSWRIFDIEAINPNLNFEVTTVPQLPTLSNLPADQLRNATDLTNIHWASYWVEGVNAKSKKQKEAWKFLEFLASKEGLEKMYTAESQIRSFGEIYPRKSMVEKLTANSRIKPFISVADNAESWYLASRTFDNGINDEMIKYFGDAINAITMENKTPEDVMPSLKSGIGQLIQKYKIRR